MSGIEAFLTGLVGFFPHPFILPFLGAILGGEETIIVLSMITAATDTLSFQMVLLASFLGTIASDVVWFWVGMFFVKKLHSRPKIRSGIETVSHFVERVSRGNVFIALLITKFLYGTRIIMLFYLAHRHLSFARFLAYNSAVTAIWALVVCAIGYLAGRGIVNLTKIFGDITLGLAVVAAVLLALYALRVWLNKRIIVDEVKSE